MTIVPIIGFLIRRHFYPIEYFNNPSFFDLNQSNTFNEQNMRLKLANLLRSDIIDEELVLEDLLTIYGDIMNILIDQENQGQTQDFKEEDFIILRPVYSNSEAIFNLVIHKENFHVFMMKKLKYTNDKVSNEINFARDYSHRCLTKFYGFLKKEDKIIGFIYEYMSNGSLESFINSNKEISLIFQLTSIYRIFQGLEFLQKNNLIHRDLKPANILLDHDFLPYISDFETIRNPSDEMTNDLGSEIYTSPEQFKGGNVSYPTDIYSFGLIIYFILEKKHLRNIEKNSKLSNNYEVFNQLFLNCIKHLPDERISIEDIKTILENELTSFDWLEKFFKQEKEKIKITELSQFFYENIFNQNDKMEQIIQCLQYTINSKYFLQIVLKRNISESAYNLGYIYENGLEVRKDYSKAKELYELSAKHNNSDAILSIGRLYYYGNGVDQDYMKAKDYYEKSANQNNSCALFNLGTM